LPVSDVENKPGAGRIEGGIDAIVIGADAEGLTAAAYLGRAGYNTILLEAGVDIGGAVCARELSPGQTYVDGEHLISILDPAVIADLDLYRHGVSYAARCLDTVYFFEDGETLQLGGDLQMAAAAFDDEETGPAFQKFITDVFEAATFCRPGFEAGPASDIEKAMRAAPRALAARLNFFSLAPAQEVLDAYLPDGPLKTALLSEAGFRSAAAPHEPFSFMTLVRRWAGEIAGLQGACAYPEGGAIAVVTALRRAAQAAKVDIRAATGVASILIEQDHAAGVELEGGGQIRAPIIVAAGAARRVFMEMIGAAVIDIEFQRAITAARPQLASGHLHLALKGVARDEKTRAHMNRRLVYAPPREALRRAFADARAGRVPSDLMIEAVFPDALDEEAGGEKMQLLSAIAHPLPFDEAPDDGRRDEIEKTILANIEKFAPDIEDRIKARALRLVSDIASSTGAPAQDYAAPPSIIEQVALARVASSAAYVGGLYFCGREARIGAGISCAAGRMAAKAALYEAKRGGRAA
jgi:phytoene dehydrogenase-like protein